MEHQLLRSILKRIGFVFCLICLVVVYNAYRDWDKQEVCGMENAAISQTIKNNSSTDIQILGNEQVNQKQEVRKLLGNRYIVIKKNYAGALPVQVEDLYLERAVKLTIHNMQSETIDTESIQLYVDHKKVNNMQIEAKQLINNSKLSYKEMEDGSLELSMLLPMTQVFGYVLYEDNENIYLDCKSPKEVYPHILVLDAGHGGTDTGSDACVGSWEEKDYNLDFVLRLQKQIQWEGWKVYCTRMDDRPISLSDRVNFANEVEADYFVSIHCNSSDEIEGTGLEALYKSNAYKAESKDLAAACMKDLAMATGLKHRDLLDGQGIYIIRKSNMPTVLLEMGFLTDPKDVAYLSKEEKREKMMKTLCNTLKRELK